MTSAADQRTEQIKRLLIKFKKNFTINSEDSPDFDDFFKLLDLNSQLTCPKALCLQQWTLVSEAQAREHKQVFGYTIIPAEGFSTKESFLQIAKDNGKCTLDDCQRLVTLVTPTTAPPISNRPQQENSQMSIMSSLSRGGAPPGAGPGESNQQDFGDEISVLNSYVGNAGGGAYAGYNQNRNMQPNFYGGDNPEETGACGVINTGIEIIRLNKKFDIFMKRFMRAEEDIKEVKQNFYRVMHCAFAKYEQGFKRKNEYLERRRVKRREEIDRGVAQELKKRGMAGELDDPLLMQSVNRKTSYEGAGHNGGKIGVSREDDSTMGLGGVGGGLDEESQTVRDVSDGRKKVGGMTGIEDSELTNNIVGLGPKKDVPKVSNSEKKKDKKSKKDKKKKDKKRDDSD